MSSYNFDNIERILTGRKLPLFILSSLLKMGLTSANLNGVGNVLIAIHVLIRLQIGTDHSLYAILINLPGMLSYPVAFLGSIFLILCITKSTVTGLNSKSLSILSNSCWIFCTLGWYLCLCMASPAEMTSSSKPMSEATVVKNGGAFAYCFRCHWSVLSMVRVKITNNP